MHTKALFFRTREYTQTLHTPLSALERPHCLLSDLITDVRNTSHIQLHSQGVGNVCVNDISKLTYSIYQIKDSDRCAMCYSNICDANMGLGCPAL